MTSSAQPPVLNPPIGTPSSEWAKETATSLDPLSQTSQETSSEQPTSKSPVETPGNELPGAYPNRDQGEPSSGTANITGTIVDTAKQYLPSSVMNKVETFLGPGTSGSDQGVRASEHDVYHKASLPSQELRGALPHEHVGGVGSLPGASVEKSVALLPDEQAEWSEWKSFAGRNTPGYETPSNLKENTTGLSQIVTQKATNLGVAAGVTKADVPQNPVSEEPKPKSESEDVGKGYPETLTSREIANAQQAVGNIKPVAFDIKQAQDVSMPSTETQGQKPGEHTGGVGSLPGLKDEQGVAVLPEERVAETTETDHPESREERPEEHREEHPEERHLERPEEQPGELGNLTDEAKESGATGVGVAGATDPLKEDTKARDPPTETETIPPEQRTTSSEPGQQSRFQESDDVAGVQRSASSEGSGEGQRKATLKEKISGGMKVVSGKLGHDKSKVEEGKKLMHGQAA